MLLRSQDISHNFILLKAISKTERAKKLCNSILLKQKSYFYFKAMNYLYNSETENKDTTTVQCS